MKNELIKRFTKKTVMRIIIFAFVMFVLSAIAQSVSPIVTNEMALTQMDNANEIFIMMNVYNKFMPVVNIAYSLVTLWFTYTIARDICKFVKTINTNNEKEN